tara:strand:+ start:153 stop:488 length:336 start_codon:yes stop_codon:yes gene_type:complete
MNVIPPTPRQREIELQVTARYDKEAKQAIARHNKKNGKNPYTRKTQDKPKPDGVLIRKLMNQAKLRPRDLAEKVKIKPDQLQKILRGVGTDQAVLDCIAEYFEIETKHIIK